MIETSAYTLNLHAIPMLLVGIVTFWLGILVYRSNRQSAAHLHFLILCGSIALWLIATSIGLCATAPDTAQAWYTLDNVGVMYISVAFYAFSAEFLRLHRPWSIRLGYGLSTLLAMMVMTQQEFITGVRQYWWGTFRSGVYSVSRFSSCSSAIWPQPLPAIFAPTHSPQLRLSGSRSNSSLAHS